MRRQKAHRLLYELHAKQGRMPEAYGYLVDYYTKKDSILSEREVTGITAIPLTTRVDRMTGEIRMEREKKHRMMIISVFSGVLLLVMFLYVCQLIRSQRRQRRYARQIYRKNVELLQSEKQERERCKALEQELARHATAASPEDAPADEESKVKYRNSSLTDEAGQEILTRISDVMADTSLITDTGFSLQQLSDRVGYSYKLVSQVINDRMGKNFKTLLAEYRIKEACRRMLDLDNYGQFTIEHIARSVGFLSRSNFSVTFKTVVGISPSEFQRNVRTDYQRGQ